MKIALLSTDEENTTARHFEDICLDGVSIKVHTFQININLDKYDMILWIDPCNFLPENIEKFTGVKIGYFIDTHRSMFKRKIMAKCFDFVFVAQKNAVHHFESMHNVAWLPLAYNDKHNSENNKNKKYEVSFIGNTSHKDSTRGREIKKILKEFNHPKTNCYHFSDMLKIYSQSKVVLNKTIGFELNMRFFEGIGSGAVLLTDQKDEFIGDLFKPGEDFINFSSPEDAIRKIRIILSDYGSYSKNAKKAQNKVLMLHTYKNRLEQILKINKKISPKTINSFNIGLFYLATNNLREFNPRSALFKTWKYTLVFINKFRRLRCILFQ
jgi:hypothetical protein